MRIATGCFMLTHGLPKFTKAISGNAAGFADPLGVGSTTSLMLTVFAEVFCAIFLVIGFATRIASFFLLVTMAVAAFYIHRGAPFAKQELAFVYLVIFITFFIFGPGKYSIDYIIAGGGGKRRR
jgi:putative oxidoreductase